MQPVLAFDVYGTLIDTQGVVEELKHRLEDPDKALEFSRRWREKQLEYSFRFGLMGAYVNFAECTQKALVLTDRAMQTGLSDNDCDHLMAVYGELPAFDDVAGALGQLKEAGLRCVAFSNGTEEAMGRCSAGPGSPSIWTIWSASTVSSASNPTPRSTPTCAAGSIPARSIPGSFPATPLT